MGEIIFSGSWFSFISISVLWLLCIVLTIVNFKYLFKLSIMARHGKWIMTIFFIVILIIILFSNFQYTSHDITEAVREFDTPTETRISEGKKVDRMSSSDAEKNFESTIQRIKQENHSNE